MKLTCEQMYPNKKARDYADSVIDGLSLEDSMLAYIIAWEEAYLSKGGEIRL